MNLGRIVQSVLVLMVGSSLISMFFLFQIDGVVKSLVNNGVQLSADWMGPYSKLTLYVFVLILFNTILAMCGLFFRGRSKREVSQLESELQQKEMMQQDSEMVEE
jgi:hypothetical protein